MDNFYFNEELECHYCGYRFFIAGDRVIQYPTFCPECGEIEVFRAAWDAGGEDTDASLNDTEYNNSDMESRIGLD